MSCSPPFLRSGIGRGMGFRDSNQDLIGFCAPAPERARQRIIDIASTQFEDTACHQYQPLTKRGNNAIGGNFNDDPLWLILPPLITSKRPATHSILDQMSVLRQLTTAKLPPTLSTLNAPSTTRLTTSVRNKLPLIGRADWNDCLKLSTAFSEDA